MILRRFFAFFIDKIIIGILLSCTLWLGNNYITEIILFFIISGCYFSYFDSSSIQGTIGKKILGIKVVNKNGDTLELSKAFIRFIVFYTISMTGILLIISVIMLICSKKMLHDLLFDTNVIRR